MYSGDTCDHVSQGTHDIRWSRYV